MGYPHPDVLLSQISSRQWEEWKIFYRLDPWGEWRSDRRTALLAAISAAKGGKKNVNIDDFMLYDPEGDRRKELKAEADARASRENLRAWLDGKIERQQQQRKEQAHGNDGEAAS